MPIISKGGRKSLKVRLIFAGIYTTLIVGTVTMVYPFMLMLSSSIASPFDFEDLRPVPKYLRDDSALFKKHLHAKYGRENFRQLAIIYGRDGDWSTWGSMRSEDAFIERNCATFADRYARYPEKCHTELSDWNAFKHTLAPRDVIPFFPDEFDCYRDFLKKKYLAIRSDASPGTFRSSSAGAKDARAIAVLNERWQRAFNSFAEILPLKSFFTEQKWFPPQRADFDDLLDYHEQLAPAQIRVIPTRMLWALYLEKRFVSTFSFTDTTGINVDQFSDLPIPTPDTPVLGPIWQEFLRSKYPLRLVTISGDYDRPWQELLRDTFKTPGAFEQQSGLDIDGFSDLRFSPTPPANPILRMYWLDFVLQNVPIRDWQLNRPVDRYRTFLSDKYETIDALNRAYATRYTDFDQIDLPLKRADFFEFAQDKSGIRWAFVTENYRKVMAFLVTKGRAIWVTVVLVGLTILGALTVNPLAAYALSRGRQATAAKILIFFLATMAFPAEVAMIPGFLLLRDLNLLNTFWALILPGLANGYSIFLLKGFFDSVPRELYEAADIDGAGELSKFWRITFPMSKPILAVIALSAFTMAYGGFMWAFLTCQNPKMWTIMVWLYDFQGRYSSEPGMCMAAFALASIPTLLVFLFCQKIIMRGIVIPTMK